MGWVLSKQNKLLGADTSVALTCFTVMTAGRCWSAWGRRREAATGCFGLSAGCQQELTPAGMSGIWGELGSAPAVSAPPRLECEAQVLPSPTTSALLGRSRAWDQPVGCSPTHGSSR